VSERETEKQRTDRQLIELLNELRVALPGGQVLLAFLLTAPFATRYGRTDGLERAVLFFCTLTTAAGVVLLMAPSIYHRLRWNAGGKADVIRVGHRLFLTGMAFLALGLSSAVFLIGDLIYGRPAGVGALAFVVLLIVSTWYALPVRRGRDPQIRERD
jgi:hypothetical protein